MCVIFTFSNLVSVQHARQCGMNIPDEFTVNGQLNCEAWALSRYDGDECCLICTCGFIVFEENRPGVQNTINLQKKPLFVIPGHGGMHKWIQCVGMLFNADHGFKLFSQIQS